MMDPLAPQPMTPEHVDDLVRRAREQQHRVHTEHQRKMVAASREAYRIARRSGR